MTGQGVVTERSMTGQGVVTERWGKVNDWSRSGH